MPPGVGESYEDEPKYVVGLSLRNTTGEIIDKPFNLVSKFITTRFGFETTSKNMFHQQPLHGDLSIPLTLVRRYNNIRL